jgi:hypothetical protein
LDENSKERFSKEQPRPLVSVCLGPKVTPLSGPTSQIFNFQQPLIATNYNESKIFGDPYMGHHPQFENRWIKAKWSLFTLYSFKIAISFGKLGLKLAVVDRLPLFRGGR